MNSEAILQRDVLDIIFENRNKLYGAYALRKFYNRRLLWSLGVMFLTVILLSALTMLRKVNGPLPFTEIRLGSVEMPHAPEVKKAIPKKKTATGKLPGKKAGGLPVIAKEGLADSIQDPFISPYTISAGMSYADPGDNIVADFGEDGSGSDTVQGQIQGVLLNAALPMHNPDIMPEYPGGLKALVNFLRKNLKHPRELSEGERVSVKVQFVVGIDGGLKSFELVEDGGTEFNNEVLRVLKKMPEWIPGKARGQNVSVYYTIPVKFLPED